MAVEKDGVPASGWAYTPDKEKTSTWKLNISDATHTAAAVAALGKGFRGNKVSIPEDDLAAVKKKVKAAYSKFFPDNDTPQVLKSVGFAEGLAQLIEKFFGGSQEEVEDVVEVTKSLDDEKRMALFVVLEPDTVDLHGDTYTEVEVEKACNNFNTHCQVANLFHQIETQNADIVQSFIAPSTFTLDNGVVVQKGTWLQWWHFPEGSEQADAMWEGVKSGDINGVSIGALATVEDLTE